MKLVYAKFSLSMFSASFWIDEFLVVVARPKSRKVIVVAAAAAVAVAVAVVVVVVVIVVVVVVVVVVKLTCVALFLENSIALLKHLKRSI